MEEKKKIKKRKTKRIIKAPKVQTIFCIISIIFIFSCCFYYGRQRKSRTGDPASS